MESPIDYPGQKDRPKSLHLQVSRASITNVRSIDQSSRTDLQKCVDMFRMCSLFYNNDFPSSNNDFSLISQKFVDHFSGKRSHFSVSILVKQSINFYLLTNPFI